MNSRRPNISPAVLKVMGHPAEGMALLVDKLHNVDEKFSRGEAVLAGSFTGPVDNASGDVIRAYYDPPGSI